MNRIDNYYIVMYKGCLECFVCNEEAILGVCFDSDFDEEPLLGGYTPLCKTCFEKWYKERSIKGAPRITFRFESDIIQKYIGNTGIQGKYYNILQKVNHLNTAVEELGKAIQRAGDIC